CFPALHAVSWTAFLTYKNDHDNGGLCMSARMFVVSVLVLVVVALFATVIFAADMFSGQWKENTAKSTVSPGPPRKEGVGKVEGMDNGLTVVLDGVNASGQKAHTEYTVKFDGKDYPSKSTLDGKPNPNGDIMVSAKKVDDYTYETTAK